MSVLWCLWDCGSVHARSPMRVLLFWLPIAFVLLHCFHSFQLFSFIVKVLMGNKTVCVCVSVTVERQKVFFSHHNIWICWHSSSFNSFKVVYALHVLHIGLTWSHRCCFLFIFGEMNLWKCEWGWISKRVIQTGSCAQFPTHLGDIFPSGGGIEEINTEEKQRR